MRLTLALALGLLVLAGCTAGGDVEVEVASVGQGEVIQTVAAAAELEPAARVTISAPVGGEVAELLVRDGDEVEAGEPLVRLASDAIDQQVAQAESAVDAAAALAASAEGAGVDVSPVVGAFRAQLDAVFPPLIAGLSDQIDALERAAASARQAADEQLAGRDPDEGDAEGASDTQGAAEGAPDAEELAEQVEGEIAEAIADARQRLAEAEAGYRDARSQLSSAEAQVRSQAQQATAAQEAAAEAQRDQAELALEAARARIDDLVIVAPIGGVVELSRGEPATSEGPDLGGLGDLGSLGGLGGQVSGGSPGRVAEGMDVGAGQPLLTIYDLSSFTVRADVDELDIVDVEVDQAVVVLVDAFPEAELAGVVSHVALAPRRPAGGGAIFAVTIDLVDVPEEVRLRTGLTASAEIEVRRVQGETVVPTSALLRRGGGEVVYRVRDGVAEEVPVSVEAIGDQTAAVSGELARGDDVVTIGVEMVEDGTEVEVVR